MSDFSTLLNVMKEAGVGANNATNPVNVCFGKVTSVSPLKVSIEQKMTLGAAQLVLTRNVTDYKTEVTIDWSTESKSGGSGDASFDSHNHSISGKKEMTIHNGLNLGDEVILLKKKGGQKYLILDKVVNT